MKKIITFTSIIFASAVLAFADSVTPASPVLILPATGARDLNRNPADKYNENFRILSASQAAANAILVTSSNTLNAKIDANKVISDAADTALTARLNNVATDTSTLKTRVDNLDTATGTIRTDVTGLMSSTNALQAQIYVIKSTNLAGGGNVYADFGSAKASTAALQSQIYNIVSTNTFGLVKSTGDTMDGGLTIWSQGDQIKFKNVDDDGNWPAESGWRINASGSQSVLYLIRKRDGMDSTAFTIYTGTGVTNKFDLNGKLVTNISNPLATTDAATKNYVDTGISTPTLALQAQLYVIKSTNLSVANSAVTIGSLTVTGTITSTAAFIGGGSTFTTVNAGNFIGDGSKLTNLPSAGQTASTSGVSFNLIVTTWGADTNSFVITADALDIMGDYYVTVATRVALSTAGAGGLDTGSEAASTWYILYACSNGSTMTVVASSASHTTAPTLPTGYTKWVKIAFVYNNSSSNIVPIYKKGKTVSLWVSNKFVNGVDPTTTKVSVDMQSLISPNTISVCLQIYGASGTNSAGFCVAFDKTVPSQLQNAGDGECFATQPVGSTGNTIFVQVPALPCMGSRTLLYYGNGISDNTSMHIMIKAYEEAM